MKLFVISNGFRDEKCRRDDDKNQGDHEVGHGSCGINHEIIGIATHDGIHANARAENTIFRRLVHPELVEANHCRDSR